MFLFWLFSLFLGFINGYSKRGKHGNWQQHPSQMAVQGPASYPHVSQDLSPDNRISQTGMLNVKARAIFTAFIYSIYMYMYKHISALMHLYWFFFKFMNKRLNLSQRTADESYFGCSFESRPVKSRLTLTLWVLTSCSSHNKLRTRIFMTWTTLLWLVNTLFFFRFFHINSLQQMFSTTLNKIFNQLFSCFTICSDYYYEWVHFYFLQF